MKNVILRKEPSEYPGMAVSGTEKILTPKVEFKFQRLKLCMKLPEKAQTDHDCLNPKKAGSSDHILIPCGTTDGNKVRFLQHNSSRRYSYI